MQEVPTLSSSADTGQHSDPVWQVRWVDRGQEQEERLVTISTDGRVTQWATTKASHLQVYVLRFCHNLNQSYRSMFHSVPDADRCSIGHVSAPHVGSVMQDSSAYR